MILSQSPRLNQHAVPANHSCHRNCPARRSSLPSLYRYHGQQPRKSFGRGFQNRAEPVAADHNGQEAIVLVDHGSRRAEANAMLEEFANLYRATAQRKIVRTAHMELASPTIAEAIAECASFGASTVVVAPFFLSRGRHITEDIPALVNAAAAKHPNVRCVIAAPLGTDELLAHLIEKRVEAAMAYSC